MGYDIMFSRPPPGVIIEDVTCGLFPAKRLRDLLPEHLTPWNNLYTEHIKEEATSEQLLIYVNKLKRYMAEEFDYENDYEREEWGYHTLADYFNQFIETAERYALAGCCGWIDF